MTDQTSQDAVLTAARELFTSKGFANTSVSEICTQAGVSPPTLYYHFGSKDGLFKAVVEETVRLDDFCRLLREGVDDAADPWDKLRAYVHTYLTAFPVITLNPGLHLGHSTQPNDKSLHCFSLGIEATYQLAREILEAGIAAGVFRELPVDTAAACILGTVDSFVRARVYLGAQYDLDKVVESIVELYGRGLAASGALAAWAARPRHRMQLESSRKGGDTTGDSYPNSPAK